MKKQLTPDEQKVLDDITRWGKKEGGSQVEVGIRFKNAGAKSWSYDGLPLRKLNSLEKKGYIKLETESNRRTGVMNKSTGSWGGENNNIRILAKPV